MTWPYSTQRWKRIRLLVLRREPFCRLCRELHERDVPATEVDHIVPVKVNRALAFVLSNLMSLCWNCHVNFKTRLFDAKGIPWSVWQLRGCNEDGTPRDPAHAWHASADAAEHAAGRDDSSESPALATGARTSEFT